MGSKGKVKTNVDEERDEVIEILNNMENEEGIPILPTVSKVRDKHSVSYYDRLINEIIEPLKEEGRIIQIPTTAKGNLIQTPENMRKAVTKLEEKKGSKDVDSELIE